MSTVVTYGPGGSCHSDCEGGPDCPLGLDDHPPGNVVERREVDNETPG